MSLNYSPTGKGGLTKTQKIADLPASSAAALCIDARPTGKPLYSEISVTLTDAAHYTFADDAAEAATRLAADDYRLLPAGVWHFSLVGNDEGVLAFRNALDATATDGISYEYIEADQGGF